MARLTTSFVVTLISIALVYVLAEEQYTDKFDDVNVEEILQNDKLRDQYYKCFMGTAPCVTGAAKFMKDFFSEAFQNKCNKCTEKQKQHVDAIVDWYTKNKPEEWQAIVAKTIEDLKKKNADQ